MSTGTSASDQAIFATFSTDIKVGLYSLLSKKIVPIETVHLKFSRKKIPLFYRLSYYVHRRTDNLTETKKSFTILFEKSAIYI